MTEMPSSISGFGGSQNNSLQRMKMVKRLDRRPTLASIATLLQN